MSKRGWTRIVAFGLLALLLVPAVGVAFGWFDRDSTQGTTALLNGPSGVLPSGTATISGTLAAVGGPASSPTPIAGLITVANVEQEGGGWLGFPVTVGPNGAFFVDVAPGLYQVIGQSPGFAGGRGRCRAERTPVLVSDGDVVVVNVFCQMK
jgi:hypothetical protein